MNAYCPECETELDQATGICPACRWDPMFAAARWTAAATQPELSLTERYRGTTYDVAAEAPEHQAQGISRGRLFVMVAFGGAVALYAVALGVMGLF